MGTPSTTGENTVHAIYWAPSGYSFPSGYANLINGFLTNVADASGTTTSVYATDTQYYQIVSGLTQYIQYKVNFGGAITDPDPYSGGGCTPDAGHGETYTACIDDNQLENEVGNVISTSGLSTGLGQLYMVFFPPNVETCETSLNESLAGTCSDTAYQGSYCAYHSNYTTTSGSTILYSNETYPTYYNYYCFTGQYPNGQPGADSAIDFVSHEQNEAITDPIGNPAQTGWFDSATYEIGDECDFTFGPPLGMSSGYYYNQLIGTGKYYLQAEFSNNAYAANPAAGCIPAPYHPLAPARIADTRTGSGQPYAGQTLGAGSTLAVQVTGSGGVPAGATAVVLNVTATNTTANSYFTVYPTGATRPLASSLNFGANATTPNLVEVGLGSGGQVSIYNYTGTADAVVDVEGYVGAGGAPAGAYNALSPARISDTRTGSGLPNAGQTLGAGGIVPVQVDGVGGVPASGVSAVVLNVTATDTTATSYLTAYADGTTKPLASNLNFIAGQTVPNRVMVPVGTDGKVDLYNYTGTVDTIVDVSGWFTDSSNLAATGSSFVATGPTRLADTRLGSGEPDAGMTLAPGASITVAVTGTGGVPAAATAVVLNVTVTDTTGSSYLTVYPTGQTQPLASDLNWAAGDTRANMAVVRPGPDGTVTVYNYSSSTDVVVDVTGYYK